MKSKAPLLLMEQMVMLVVFALAAALCVQAFVKSDELSRRSEERDQAVVLCQEAAETLRHFGGDGSNRIKTAEKLGYHIYHGVVWQEFDENWNPVDFGVYRIDIDGIPSNVPGVETAYVGVAKGYNAGEELDILFELEVCWQCGEVGAYG